VYQFNVDEYLNNDADEVDVNACAVVYTSDREFGKLEPIPTSLTSPSCHDLPSTKIDHDTIKHLTKSQQSELHLIYLIVIVSVSLKSQYILT